MAKTILKQLPDEDIYYNFEDQVELDYYGDNIIICGNRDFQEFGDATAIDIIKNDYEDDDCGYDYDVLEELEKVFGKKYYETSIGGYSQSDWQRIYYTDEIDNIVLKSIEDFYFGKVDEFFDEEEGISYIVPHDVVWKGSKAICDYCGLDSEDTDVLKISGTHKVYEYLPIDD